MKVRAATTIAALLIIVLSGCAGSRTGASSSADPEASEAAESPTASSASAPSSDPSASAAPSSSVAPGSSSPAEPVIVDALVRMTADRISVRADPATAAERIAVLAEEERVYIVDGPVNADGYDWYLVAPADRYATDCNTAPPQAFACAGELGWAASASAEGDPWMVRVELECPTEPDTEAYLALNPVERLACAGDTPWTLVTYLAPETGGRGCLPVWTVDPFWMDQSCAFFFPQPVESTFDSDTQIQAFIPPTIGACDAEGCPFDALKGSWVQITGHLDDPVADTCTMVLNGHVDNAPFPPIGPELTAFSCRLNFVIDEVVETDPPAGS